MLQKDTQFWFFEVALYSNHCLLLDGIFLHERDAFFHSFFTFSELSLS